MICYQCSRASDSFWIGVYSWNHKKDPKWSLFCHMVMKAHTLVQYSDLVQHPHKKAIQPLVATSPWWCEQWLGTVNKDNHSPFCRWCTYLVSLYKNRGYVLSVLRPQWFSGRCEWDSEQSKLVKSYYWVWHQFSFNDLPPKSHTQGIFNCRRVPRTHISMFDLTWQVVIIGTKYHIMAIFHAYKGRKLFCSTFYNTRLQGPS